MSLFSRPASPILQLGLSQPVAPIQQSSEVVKTVSFDALPGTDYEGRAISHIEIVGEMPDTALGRYFASLQKTHAVPGTVRTTYEPAGNKLGAETRGVGSRVGLEERPGRR